jgi:dTMP kinase
VSAARGDTRARDATGARRGLCVVLDGIDGCGKSTQAARLVVALEQRTGVEPLHLREPGGTDLGERLRALLLSRELDLSARVETLLFAAARAQMLDEKVRPALAAGRHVVCERFHPSTFAYQAVAGGLPEERVLDLLHAWAGEPAPDLVIVLDVRPERASARRAAPSDRIEDKGLAFQRRVAEGFRMYARRDPAVVVVDGDRAPDEVERAILDEVTRAL